MTAEKCAYQPGDVVVYDSNHDQLGYDFCAVTVALRCDGRWMNVATGGVVDTERVLSCGPRLMLRDGRPLPKADEASS